MSVVSELRTNFKIRASEITHRTFILPLLIFYPTGRCNSRCLSCEWWKSTGEGELSLEEIDSLSRALRSIGTRVVAFSGGEPLLRPDVFEIASLFRREQVRLELLTSGVLLHRHIENVAAAFDRVTISLDAASPELYREIRGIDALGVIEAGVERLRAAAPELPITARTTIHQSNFREMPRIIRKARDMRLDGISFLAADISSTAFGRQEAPPAPDELILDAGEIEELRSIIEATIEAFGDELRSGFIAESPAKLRGLADYYSALHGDRPFPAIKCNAPWISAVIEANGGVRPCFFHEPIGNIRKTPLVRILRENLPAFRRRLDVSSNPVCTRCVCSIKVGWGGSACP